MALIQVNYLSKALYRTVPLNVILPADKIDYGTGSYRMKEGERFQTLYLLHGLLGNYTDWVSGTRIQRWAEEKNLAVVMPSGDNSFYFKQRTPWDDYETFIGKELVEVTRKMFPLSDRREDTLTWFRGKQYAGDFGYADLGNDLFADRPGTDEHGLFEDAEAAAATDLNPTVALENLLAEGRKMPKFYLACGLQDFLLQDNLNFREFLLSKGADMTWDEEDAGHEWDFWDSQIKKVLDWLPLGSTEGGLGSGNVKVE